MYSKYDKDVRIRKYIFLGSLIFLGGIAYYTLIYSNNSDRYDKNPSALEQKVDTLDSTKDSVKESK